MLKAHHLATVLLVIGAWSAHAQETIVDSLKTALKLADHDTTKISILIDLAYEQYPNDSLQLAAAMQAYELGKKVSFPQYIARSEAVLGYFLAQQNIDSGASLLQRSADRYLEHDFFMRAANALYFKGVVHRMYGNSDSALVAYKKAAEIAAAHEKYQELGNSAYSIANILNTRGDNVGALHWAIKAKEAYEKGGFRKEVGQVMNLIGIIYDQKGLYSEALESYLEAREIAIETGDVANEILINNNIGVIYDEMQNHSKAMQYYGDALEKSRINNMKDNEATLLNNLSYVHLENGDTAMAVGLLKKSLKIDLSEIYPCFESYPLEGLGSVYLSQKKLDSAEILYKRALKTGMICEDAAVLTSVYKGLGKLNIERGDFDQAEEFLMKSLDIAQKAEMKLEAKETLYELFQLYKAQNNVSRAMTYLELYQSLVDFIYKEKNVEKATQLAAEYDFRKQVTKMEQERLEAEKKFTAEIAAKTNQNRLILLAFVLFFLLAATLGRSYYLIQQRNKKLKWLNDEKNKLMGIVAHDLRNPLNMIIGLMPLIQETASKHKDKNLEKYVELLEASTQRMRDMIDRVLDISAIENMKLNLKLEKANLTELTYTCIHNFDVIAAQKDIKIIDHIDQSTPCYAKVDANYLMQVIDNLLSNAIKFSDRGKKIGVSLNSVNNHYEIAIKDEGPGISQEEQKKLFQAYTTLSSKPTEQERSTGLGMSIAFKFIKAMGGKIECDSKVGEGTTFRLIFEKA